MALAGREAEQRAAGLRRDYQGGGAGRIDPVDEPTVAAFVADVLAAAEGAADPALTKGVPRPLPTMRIVAYDRPPTPDPTVATPDPMVSTSDPAVSTPGQALGRQNPAVTPPGAPDGR